MEGKSVRRIIFLAFFLGLFLLVARLFYPFLTILLWSGLLYALLAPLYSRLTMKRDGGDRSLFTRNVWAGVLALGGVLVLVVPLVMLGVSMARQLGDLANLGLRALENHPEILDLSPRGAIGGFVYRLTDGAVNLAGVDIRGELVRFFSGSMTQVISLSGSVLRNAATFLISLAFMVFTLFFFFVDGGHLVRILINAIPIEREYTKLFLRKFRDTSRQLVVGFFLVSLYQAVVAFVLFSLFGVRGALVLSALTAVASFIPMVGAGLVWFPVSAIVIISGNLTGGVALLLLCALFISTLDNFIRPLLLGERLQLHPLLIFFSILGGLQLFGFNGLILGPLILILFFTGARLYDRVYDPAEGAAEAQGHAEASASPPKEPRA
ncbi:MAG: AI-2E family transporter [Spirochaetaceae bacterium]|nr:AI-2E family transporter [Spirochaetaceae bacterium]